MYKKIVNIEENLTTNNSDRLLDKNLQRDYLLLVKESKMTGARRVMVLIKISDYKHPGVAYGVVKRKYHELLEQINQDRYRLFPLDIQDQEELSREGISNLEFSGMMQAVSG